MSAGGFTGAAPAARPTFAPGSQPATGAASASPAPPQLPDDGAGAVEVPGAAGGGAAQPAASQAGAVDGAGTSSEPGGVVSGGASVPPQPLNTDTSPACVAAATARELKGCTGAAKVSFVLFG